MSPGLFNENPPHLLDELLAPLRLEGVGYRSAVGFHLAFRRHFGAPPGEYRRASRRRPGT